MVRPELVALRSHGSGRSKDAVTELALDSARVAAAKAAYTVRRVPREALVKLLGGAVVPHTGDLLLARIDAIGQHDRIELADGRRAMLFPGDEVIVCYGNRYAPDQFEAVVPEALDPCDLVAAGGIAALSRSRHRKMRAATRITPIGLLADAEGNVVNLSRFALPRLARPKVRPLVVAFVGTSMNAGKTTAAAHLVRGLTRAGLRVGAAKVTGTGAGGDTWLLRDAGALPVLDFTDAGHASTYLASRDAVEITLETLVAHLAAAGVDAIVLEIADGLLQQETAALLESPIFDALVDRLVFAAGDAMGAAAGVQWLAQRNIPVAAITGALTQAPLAIAEASAATRLPVLRLDELSDPTAAGMLLLDAAAEASCALS
jgi:dethiobiotin synthetase